ncbi:MAG TPA: sigma-70 family RNA polymerase sigma factor [Blastocatellia bacterium]|nr:sigma-70 family RNA polymerase sigma factor [Blastocatellia bacterium]
MDADRHEELARLLSAAQDGDQEAYESFLVGASKLLRGFLQTQMGGDGMVEDVLQDTLLSIHRARHTFLPGRALGPWLYAICKHRMIDHYRRSRRIMRREVSESEIPAQRAASIPHPSESRAGGVLSDALAKLPKSQRHVVELLKVHDMSIKEAAARTGMSESAVKVTAHRGYKTLRRLFGV